MSRLRKLPWVRISAEVVAIVSSILLAFAIEAWWESRQEREAERLLLTSLRAEFSSLREEITYARAYNEGIRESGRELILASLDATKSLSDSQIDGLLTHLWYNQELAAYSMPELVSTIASGDIQLISDSKIRRIISSWPARLSAMTDRMQRDLDFFSDRLMPFLSANASLAQLNSVEHHIPGHPNESYEAIFAVETDEATSHRKLLSDPMFRNILFEREVLLTDILYLGMHGIDEELNRTLALIDAELTD